MKVEAALLGPYRWWIVAGLLLVIGLFNTSVMMGEAIASPGARLFSRTLVCELTGSMTVLILLPVLLRWFKLLPLTTGNLPWALPLHLLASMVYGAVHTLLMQVSRVAVYASLSWPAYHDERPLQRLFIDEYQKQVIVYCGVAAVVALVGSIERYRQQQQRTVELEQQLTRAQLDLLKAQLQPHFLFNTLNLVSCLVREDADKAEHILGELGAFLRLTLRHANQQEVPLSEDIRFLRAYINIMQARFGDRLSVQIDVAPGVEAAMVPHLVLQPLVENAVQQTTHASEEAAQVFIEARKQDGHLSLVVEDNGPGPDAAYSTNGTGIGLTSTRERLEALYGADQALRLNTRTGGGARVQIELPFREARES